jgi:hypothetical protein
MFRISRLSRRTTLALALGATTVTAASAATFHRLATTQTTGSEGALTILQTGASASALQGEVASSVNTGIKLPFGVLGEYNAAGSKFGVGTLGISTTGYAVAAESLSTTQPSILADAAGGGIGIEAVTPSNSGSPAIYASSAGGGDGVDGVASGGYGLSGSSSNGGSGVYGVSNDYGDGVYGQSAEGYGVFGITGDAPAEQLINESASSYVLKMTNQDDGPLIEADNGQCLCLTLDGGGNLRVSGSVISAGETLARTRNPNSDLMTYGEQSAVPTMDDVGYAQLVDGSATVPLAADFRQTVDGSRYMVFLTPHGDSNGLYVASESAAGFVVRESHGGRSTLAFDYRIVAQQYGAHGGRLPHAPPPGRATPSVKDRLAIQRARNHRQFVPPPLMPLTR